MNKHAMQNVFSGILVLCALVVTVLVVRRELVSDGQQASPERTVEISPEEWDSLTRSSQGSAPNDAEAVIVAFVDFQCAFCSQADTILQDLQRKHPNELEVLYRHFPMPNLHTSAYSAAIAAECARKQHRFKEYRQALFRNQAQLPDGPWMSLAEEVEIQNRDRFRQCILERDTKSIVDRHIRLGETVGVRATPTFFLNGRKYIGVGTFEEWHRRVRNAIGK